MKLHHPRHLFSLPRRAYRLAAALLAYFTMVGASVGAASALVTQQLPLVVGGL